MSVFKVIIAIAISKFIEPYAAEILIILSIVILLCFVGNNYVKLKKGHCQPVDNDTPVDKNDAGQSKPMPDTSGLMFDTLGAMGCQPTKNPDGTLSVMYQGENFNMNFGGMYARIWDSMWAVIRADNPNLPAVKEAVNSANFGFGPTVVLTAPDENGWIGLHSRMDIMLHPACPDNVEFVSAVLKSFFDTKENVRSRFQQINASQMENERPSRPIGFAPNNPNA